MIPVTFTVGKVRIHLVSDGPFAVDGGGCFGVVPRAQWARLYPPDERHNLHLESRCVVVESQDGLVLVDTGNGDKLTPKQRTILELTGERRLIAGLAALGFTPEDVRAVVNTHLHADHCGGNTVRRPDGTLAPAFPNATYHIQRLELADASYPNERTRNTYFADNFEPLLGHAAPGGQAGLHVLFGDSQVAAEVRTQVAPGHTRAHQVVIIESDGETAVFLADAAPLTVSMEKVAWVAAFDVEPLVSIETRRALREWLWRWQALLLFQHDPAVAAGRLARDGDAWRVEKVA